MAPGQRRRGQLLADLLRLLQPYFRNTRIFETIYPSRHNMYFFAGDGELPFDEAWPAQIARRGSGVPVAAAAGDR